MPSSGSVHPRGYCIAGTLIVGLFVLWILSLADSRCDQHLRSGSPSKKASTKPHFLSDEDYFTVMSNMPIPTVDVLLVDHEHTKTLLFKRSNKPVQHVFYSLGGRIYKNERVEEAAGV